jgi:DNA polymerase III subunit delta'
MPFRSDAAIDLVQRAMNGGRLGHAYLITGPDEADREGFATRMLNLVSGEHLPDLESFVRLGAVVLRPQSKSRRITIGDDSSEQGTIRYLNSAIHKTSAFGGHKFGIIVDADRMNPQAQNALLRTLEEPPPRTLFLLLTRRPRDLLPTIFSRVLQIELVPEPGARRYTEHERKLLALLEAQAQRGQSSIAIALSLKAGFEEVLDELHTDVEKASDEEFAREKDRYGKTTDSGTYLKNLEDQLKATTEAHYLQQRDAMLELLLSWMADIVRHKVGAPHFDLPEYVKSTAVAAEKVSIEEAQRRLRVLHRLESHLHTNVNQNLALEVCFTEAFGQ